MKHRTTKLILFLFLGAIINIAVAWTCVLNPWHVKQSSGGPLDLQSQITWWRTVAPPDMSEPHAAQRLRIPGVDQDLLTGDGRPSVDQPPNTELIEQTIRMRAGLPLRSLQGDRFNYVRVSSDNMMARRFDWLIWPPEVLVSKRIEYQRPMLPLSPLWPGFAINTVFYAAILWLLFAIPGTQRRRRRLKRGLCPACAYPMGTGEMCTECGRPVARAASIRQ